MRGLPIAIVMGFAAATMARAQEPRPPRGEPDTIQLERGLAPGVSPEGRFQILTTRRARLGIFFNMRNRDADSLGVMIRGVTPGGPAAKAGLRSGDIITRFNGTSLVGDNVRSSGEPSGPGVGLALLMAGVGPGDTVAVEYRRGKHAGNASIIAGDEPFLTWSMPDGGFGYSFGDSLGEPEQAMRRMGEGWRVPFKYRVSVDSLRVLGESLQGMSRLRVPPPTIFMLGTPLEDLELAPLNPDLGRYFGTSEGILVIRVPEDSKLGLKAGDVVLSVDGRTPMNPGHLLRILRSYEEGERFKLQIMRMKRKEMVTGQLGER
jgi:S1-C subfamily serine protease